MSRMCLFSLASLMSACGAEAPDVADPAHLPRRASDDEAPVVDASADATPTVASGVTQVDASTPQVSSGRCTTISGQWLLTVTRSEQKGCALLDCGHDDAPACGVTQLATVTVTDGGNVIWALHLPGVLDSFEGTIDEDGHFFTRGTSYAPDAATWAGTIDAQCHLAGELNLIYGSCTATTSESGVRLPPK
ncbi:MAG TPA: hypothetical protein VM580_18125 [Labilithrix sp.]|jgi:hypothetical protein|nr:hypothetical protein [Labilithrix sp.]